MSTALTSQGSLVRSQSRPPFIPIGTEDAHSSAEDCKPDCPLWAPACRLQRRLTIVLLICECAVSCSQRLPPSSFDGAIDLWHGFGAVWRLPMMLPAVIRARLTPSAASSPEGKMMVTALHYNLETATISRGNGAVAVSRGQTPST